MVAEENSAAHTDQEADRPQSPLVEEHDSNLLIEGTDGAWANLDDIYDVIKNGEVYDVENLVEKFGMECLAVRDRHGYTPSHWVALNGNVEMMRYLIERSAPIDC